MIDFNKQADRILFVSNVNEIKDTSITTNHTAQDIDLLDKHALSE